MYLIIAVLVIVGVTYSLFTKVLPQFFYVPPHNWKEKIEKVINYAKPIYLQVGWKRSSYRRRLILASVQPLFYTNYINNKVKIQAEDSSNENNSFIDAMAHRDVDDTKRKIIYGFFHPYANNGGGGERVLWEAVKATLLHDDKNIVAIYTTNTDAEPLQILAKAEQKFLVSVDSSRVVFIYLRKYGRLIDGDYWKHFTLIGQLFGSFLLALEAMYELSPDVWIDTIGLPGSYFPANIILKVPILAYTHYPIIQREMFGKLKFRSFSASELKKFSSPRDLVEIGKLAYWGALYYFYMYLGSLIDVTLTNGTWTYNHLSTIFAFNKVMGKSIDILYPACGTETLTSGADITGPRENKMLYIAQFRPEKRHDLLVKEYHQFLVHFKKDMRTVGELPTLVFLGSCRTKDDTATLTQLKLLVSELDLEAYVEFVVDCAYEEVVAWLARAKFGLNAMWNEHFGIGVVEYLSRGAIPIVHASAGPLLDIVLPWNEEPTNDWHNNTGFFFKSSTDSDYDASIKEDKQGWLLFKTKDNGTTKTFPTFETALIELFITHPELVAPAQLIEMRQNAAKLVTEKFSDKSFDLAWMKHISAIEPIERLYRELRRGNVERVY